MSNQIRVVLAEDHRLLREGVRALLAADPDIEVVAEASTGREAVEAAVRLEVDLMLMDVRMPDMDGIEATACLREQRPQTSVIMLSLFDEPALVERALGAGARGYVLKGAGVDCLQDAIDVVRRGGVYLSPGLPRQALIGRRQRASSVLTERELEVLALIAKGYTNREIARELGLSPKTVDNHRTHIMEKLDIHNTAGLVRYALAKGFEG